MYDRDDYKLLSLDRARYVKDLYFSEAPFIGLKDRNRTIAKKLGEIWNMETNTGDPIGSMTYNHVVHYHVVHDSPQVCGGRAIDSPMSKGEYNYAIQYDCYWSNKDRRLESPRIQMLFPFGDRTSIFHSKHNYRDSIIRKAMYYYDSMYPYTIALDLDNYFIYMVYPVIEKKELTGLHFQIFTYVDPEDKFKKKFWTSIVPNLTSGNEGEPFYIGIRLHYLLPYIHGQIGLYHLRQDGLEIVFSVGSGERYHVCNTGYINSSCFDGHSGPFADRF